MEAELIVRDKFKDGGCVTEIVVWKLTAPVPGCRHRFKYRFYFGLDDGTCIFRYDNERGKGDHRHIDNGEETYRFTTLQQLFDDFNDQKAAWRLARRKR